jgi:hypothetical protein
LDVLDWAGMCYGSCGKVTLERLFNGIYVEVPTKSKGAAKNSSKIPF